LQAALDTVAKWSEANFFSISQEIRSKPENHLDPTLEWTNIGGSQHTQNSGAYTGQTTNIEITHRNGESKMQQETQPFETSGGTRKRERINQPY
jgi:hypothetical protein